MTANVMHTIYGADKTSGYLKMCAMRDAVDDRKTLGPYLSSVVHICGPDFYEKLYP